MTEPNAKAHASIRSRQFNMTNGGMMVFASLTLGDTVNARRLADWLQGCVRERLTIEDAEARLVHLVHHTILKA
jgi:hypothetical protein